MGEIDDIVSKMHGSMMNCPYKFAIILLSDDIFEARSQAHKYKPTSCHAHAQYATI